MSGPYRDPTLNELREKYEKRISELEAENTRHTAYEAELDAETKELEKRIADLTEDRDLWKQSEASCAEHNRELWARVAELETALKEVVRTLRYQVKLAVRVGGEVALYEGNATAWEQARAALKEDT
jgi:DNA repair exonuclease SbcCD ATPase subunit